MLHLKHGLGDAYYYEAARVAEKIDALEVKDEISFTYDDFLSEQLYDTIFEAFDILDMRECLVCGVNRWFGNKDETDMFSCDFRNDIIIVRREK